MKRIVYVGLAIMVVCALLVSGACAPKAAEKATLKIGATMPLTGPASSFGDPMTKIAQTYVDLLNRDGGVTIGGTQYTIEFFVEDDKYTPEGASSAATKLFDVYGVNAIVGSWLAPIVATVGDMAAERNKVYLSALVYYPGAEILGPERPTSFSLIYNTFYMMQHSFERLAPVIGAKNVATIWDDYDIPRMTASIYQEMAPQWEQELGFKLVSEQFAPMETSDFTPYLLKIAALPEGVDTIAGDVLPFHLAIVCKQGYEMNPEWQYFSQCFLTDVKEYVNLAGYEAAQRCYTASGDPWDFKEEAPPEYFDMANRIREEYKVKYGTELSFGGGFLWMPNQLAAYLDACKQAGSIETEAVIQALETKEIKHFYGTSRAAGEQTFGLKRALNVEVVATGKIEGYVQVPVVQWKTSPLP